MTHQLSHSVPIDYIRPVDFIRILVLRTDRGYHCGYLGFPENINAAACESSIPIHGGWTYSNLRAPHEENDGRYYLGFACAHAGDFNPLLEWRAIQAGASTFEEFLHAVETETYHTAAMVEAQLLRALSIYYLLPDSNGRKPSP